MKQPPYFPDYDYKIVTIDNYEKELTLETTVRLIRNGIWYEYECTDSSKFFKEENEGDMILYFHKRFIKYCQNVQLLHNPKSKIQSLKKAELQISEEERLLNKLQTNKI